MFSFIVIVIIFHIYRFFASLFTYFTAIELENVAVYRGWAGMVTGVWEERREGLVHAFTISAELGRQCADRQTLYSYYKS